MTAYERWLFYTANLLVGGTGLVYGAFRYFVRTGDPEAVGVHAAQPLWQHLHLWFAPLLVLAIGHLHARHAWAHWRDGVRSGRRSGLSLLTLAAPMTVSGYLIQTSVDERWRAVWIVVHGTTSLLWLAAALAHAWARRRGQGKRASPWSGSGPWKRPAPLS